MNAKPLKITTAMLGLIPLLTGVLTMMGISDPIYNTLNLPAAPLLDSNLRFFGGVWLGLGITILWMAPNIEHQTTLFRVVWGCIFIGGMGRLISMAFVGTPPVPFIGITLLEIVGAPVFVYWQANIANSHRGSSIK